MGNKLERREYEHMKVSFTYYHFWEAGFRLLVHIWVPTVYVISQWHVLYILKSANIGLHEKKISWCDDNCSTEIKL